jgi:hypothetical protein
MYCNLQMPASTKIRGRAFFSLPVFALRRLLELCRETKGRFTLFSLDKTDVTAAFEPRSFYL